MLDALAQQAGEREAVVARPGLAVSETGHLLGRQQEVQAVLEHGENDAAQVRVKRLERRRRHVELLLSDLAEHSCLNDKS